ncbi:MAG: tRNA pseudouridine synthase A [Myxococcota bacterium]
MSVLLRVGYDGTDFHGYAGQKPRPDGSKIRTVQGELEQALATLYKVPVPTRAASRTDAGVHAFGQLATFTPPAHIPMPGLVRGLNAQLPDDIVVFAAWEQDGDVDVRRGSEGKYYRYRIRCTEVRDPLQRRAEWHLGRRLDPRLMQAAATSFSGTHDFGSFRASGCQSKTTERTVEQVEITFGASALGPMSDRGRLDARVRNGDPGPGPASAWGPDWLEVHVWGQAFLMNMVRIMVGTLVEVGLGRRTPGNIVDLLRTPDRTQAGMTAPACGLTLVEVRWPTAPMP